MVGRGHGAALGTPILRMLPRSATMGVRPECTGHGLIPKQGQAPVQALSLARRAVMGMDGGGGRRDEGAHGWPLPWASRPRVCVCTAARWDVVDWPHPATHAVAGVHSGRGEARVNVGSWPKQAHLREDAVGGSKKRRAQTARLEQAARGWRRRRVRSYATPVSTTREALDALVIDADAGRVARARQRAWRSKGLA